MAYSRLPQVYIWGETPTTPARLSQQTDDDFDDGPHTPCDFMPQSSAPVMILSSTTRRTRKSVDERAIRLLLPAPDGKLVHYKNQMHIELIEHRLSEHRVPHRRRRGRGEWDGRARGAARLPGNQQDA
jgi:hypothetical protein